MKIKQDPVTFKLNKHVVGSTLYVPLVSCQLLTSNFFQVISPEAQKFITALLIKVQKSKLLFSNPLIFEPSRNRSQRIVSGQLPRAKRTGAKTMRRVSNPTISSKELTGRG